MESCSPLRIHCTGKTAATNKDYKKFDQEKVKALRSGGYEQCLVSIGLKPSAPRLSSCLYHCHKKYEAADSRPPDGNFPISMAKCDSQEKRINKFRKPGDSVLSKRPRTLAVKGKKTTNSNGIHPVKQWNIR